MYDAVIVGGVSFDIHGRPLGPVRLRTAAEKAGYTVKVVDYASTLDASQLLTLLSCLITEQTLLIGISASWFDQKRVGSNSWATTEFFDKLKLQFPKLQIVIGGTKIVSAPLLHAYSDWFLIGFSDISFVSLLNHLSGDKVNLKYIKDNHGVKIIESDIHYKVENMDELETVFIKDDGFLPYQPLPIEISRGCIFKCAFCTHPFLGKKSFDYIRTAESISTELRRNYELFGTTRYFISDDTFNDSIEKLDRVKRAVDLAKLPAFEFVSYIRPELLITQPKMISMLKDLGLKGAHFGVESMNQPARKIVGKGTDINRVLDIAHKLRSEIGTKIHASFILGLPNDTVDDYYKWQKFFINNKNEIFNSWEYMALGIMKSTTDAGYSLIEKNPESYGYIMFDKPGQLWREWKSNTGLTFRSMIRFSEALNAEAMHHKKLAAWDLGAAWFHNVSSDDIDNKVAKDINLLSIAKINSTNRSLQNYNSIVK